MKRIEISSANTAGMRVTSGASSDRKMSSRVTMNQQQENLDLAAGAGGAALVRDVGRHEAR
jgi:hypothetical protein